MAAAYTRVGDVLGNPNYPSLGRPVEALENFEKAHEILSNIQFADDRDIELARKQSEIHRKLGVLAMVLGDTDRARREFDAALGIVEVLRTEYPEQLEYQTRSRALFREAWASLR